MTLVICILLPALFLMFMREKVLGKEITCGFNQEFKSFIKEYLITLCFLNAGVISIAYLFFHHSGAIDKALLTSAKFAFKYLLLALTISLVEPYVENIIRFHFKSDVEKINVTLKIDAIFYIYAVILLGMNFARVFDNAFWGDEGYSIRLAKLGFSEMIKATAADVHPPLHYILLQILYKIFGNHGYTYHLAGFLPYVVIMVIACSVVRKDFGKIPSAILVTMASIMQSAVRYNVECRMYSLAAMFVLISFIAFFRIIKGSSSGAFVVFCISSLGAAYTHYYALIAIAFMYLMMLPLAIKRKISWVSLIVSWLATIACYLPWLSILAKAFGRTSNYWWVKDIPSVKSCIEWLFDKKWLTIISIIFMILFFVYESKLLVIESNEEEKNIKNKFEFKFNFSKQLVMTDEMYLVLTGIISVIGTIGVGLLLSYLIRPFFVLRYMFPLSAIVYLMVGISISKLKLPRFWNIVMIVCILFINIPTYCKTFKNDHNLNSNTSKFLEKIQPEKDSIIITNNSHLNWSLLEYYYPEIEHKHSTDPIKAVKDKHETIWLFWDKALENADIDNIKKQNCTVKKVYNSRWANNYMYTIYEVKKVKK